MKIGLYRASRMQYLNRVFHVNQVITFQITPSNAIDKILVPDVSIFTHQQHFKFLL